MAPPAQLVGTAELLAAAWTALTSAMAAASAMAAVLHTAVCGSGWLLALRGDDGHRMLLCSDLRPDRFVQLQENAFRLCFVRSGNWEVTLVRADQRPCSLLLSALRTSDGCLHSGNLWLRACSC